MDKLTPEQRSENMSAVKSKDTTPELRVRKALHAMGYRFRLHRQDLPGTPDIVLPKYHLCVFVHGCYWHQHPDCKRATTPETNRDFWVTKLQKNILRDRASQERLRVLGWRVRVIWECEAANAGILQKLIEGLFT